VTANKVLPFGEQDNGLTAVQVPEISLKNLHLAIWDIHNSNLNTQERYQRLIELLVGLTNASGCMVFMADTESGFAIGPRILSKQLTQWHTDIVSVLGQLAEKSQQQQQLLIETLPASPDIHMLASPINGGEKNSATDVITLVLLLRRQPVETFATVLQLISGTANLVFNKTPKSESEPYDLTKRIQSFTSSTEAETFIVDWLASKYNCQQVMLGLQGTFKKPRLQAISGQAAFDKRSELTRLFESASAEVVSTRQIQLHQKGENNQPFLKAIADQLNAEQIVAVPLTDFQGDVFGAVFLLWKQADQLSSMQRKSIHQDIQVIGGALHSMLQGYPGFFKQTYQQLWTKANTHKRIVSVVAPLLLLAALFFPVDYIISSNSIVQPVQRRFIAAHFDGVLEKSHVRPGDVVVADQLLARLDERELNWQLSGLQADRSKALKKRDLHLASGDTPAAQMAGLEIKRINVQADLLQYQSEHLDVRSPIAGLVLVGDLQREEGVSVQRGQKLFEIAPLDNVLVEVAIPADEIRHYHDGMPVAVQLEAFPGKVWETPLTRLFPSSIVREGENVFLGEIELKNPQGLLRPGMRGRAKLNAGSKPLIWVWLHKPWAKINEWLFW
jgi:multidrug efflux pump subunit AcrA (membrane-fusion protein)